MVLSQKTSNQSGLISLHTHKHTHAHKGETEGEIMNEKKEKDAYEGKRCLVATPYQEASRWMDGWMDGGWTNGQTDSYCRQTTNWFVFMPIH